MNQIKSWLESSPKDYSQGVALLCRYSKNAALIRCFNTRPQTPQRLKDLIYQLSKLSTLPVKSAVPPKHSQKSPSTPTKRTSPSSFPSHKDKILDELISEKNERFKRYVALFHQLEYFEPDKRRRASLEILEIWKQIEEYWRKIDYYKKHGTLPVATSKKGERSAKDMMSRMMTLRTYISRYKKKVAQAKTFATREKYQRKLDEYSAELFDLEKKLSG